MNKYNLECNDVLLSFNTIGIGLNNIVKLDIRKTKSKLRGNIQALHIMANFDAKFEFIFSSMVTMSPRLFITVQVCDINHIFRYLFFFFTDCSRFRG